MSVGDGPIGVGPWRCSSFASWGV